MISSSSVKLKLFTLLTFFLLFTTFLPTAVFSDIFDLKTQWSNTTNPNGAWTYREGTNALPGVAAWQAGGFGGWNVAQPGWAESANGNNRTPFWFQSNGSETFAHDWLAGDIIVHSQDNVSGIGNGPSNVLWTSNINGMVDISGSTWIGRDIGRSNRWNLYRDNTLLSFGDTSSGDAFSRANPFNFASGSGGLLALSNIPVSIGDTIRLEIAAFGGQGGDFQGVNFAVTSVPEPSTLALGLIATTCLIAFRQRRSRLNEVIHSQVLPRGVKRRRQKPTWRMLCLTKDQSAKA